MGFIFLNFDSQKNESGNLKITKFIALKTNETFTVLSSFEKELSTEHYVSSIQNMLSEFEIWLKNPYEYKFVTFYEEDMKTFIEQAKKYTNKSNKNHFYKIIQFQYWNIQSEMVYRLGLRNETISLPDLLSVYGVDFVGDEVSSKTLLYNTYTLATFFKMDGLRNQKVFVKKKNYEKTNETYNQSNIPLLHVKPLRITGEEILRKKCEEGWNIQIQCERTLTGIQMSAIASNSNDEKEGIKQAKGQTLEELMVQLFSV